MSASETFAKHCDGRLRVGSSPSFTLQAVAGLPSPPPNDEDHLPGLSVPSGFDECNVGFRQELPLSAADPRDCNQS